MPAGLQTCAMTREDRVRTGLRIVAAAFREGKLAAWTANGATGSPISPARTGSSPVWARGLSAVGPAQAG